MEKARICKSAAGVGLMFELRKYPRFEFKTDLFVRAAAQPLGRQVEYYARTLNFSRGGILFHSIACFDRRTRCVVRFENVRGDVVTREGVILRAGEEAPDSGQADALKPEESIYALEFDAVLTEAEFSSLMARDLPV